MHTCGLPLFTYFQKFAGVCFTGQDVSPYPFDLDFRCPCIRIVSPFLSSQFYDLIPDLAKNPRQILLDDYFFLFS